jgi:hypothetical protein
MSKFSERIGVTRPRAPQLDGMDEPLKNALWNWLCLALDREDSGGRSTWREEYWHNAAEGGVWDEIMHRRVDEIPLNPKTEWKSWFMAAQWYEVYECLEFVLPRMNGFRGYYGRQDYAKTLERLNRQLEREMSGYRIVNEKFVPITAPEEIAAIQAASKPTSGFEGVSTHISTALALLGKKPDPDYRNSIKEAISAVETAVKLLTGDTSRGIDTALAILDGEKKLHPAMKLALSKLYAYTSDDDGIRHSILDEPNVTEAHARFMLVACSAFANFLIGLKAQSATERM